jgi:hypothetical protein
MPRKRFSAEQIIHKLREAEVELPLAIAGEATLAEIRCVLLTAALHEREAFDVPDEDEREK